MQLDHKNLRHRKISGYPDIFFRFFDPISCLAS